MHGIHSIADTHRYPLHRPRSAALRALVRRGRARLAGDAVFSLPGFIRPGALQRMRDEARELAPAGHHHERLRDGVALCSRHATRVSLSCVGYDQIPASSPMRRIFLWDDLTRFVGAVLGRGPRYRSADPIAGCMLTALGVGDELGWHFDDNDGAVTLLLEDCTSGGLFEYVPRARRLDAGAIGELVDGRRRAGHRHEPEPGTLTLFNGRQALHRVSRVAAGPARLTLILCYDSRPGQIFSDTIRRGFFDRTEALAPHAGA